MRPTVNAFTLPQRIPRAQLLIHSDSGHGAIFSTPRYLSIMPLDSLRRTQHLADRSARLRVSQGQVSIVDVASIR
jgi:hypothetical protein